MGWFDKPRQKAKISPPERNDFQRQGSCVCRCPFCMKDFNSGDLLFHEVKDISSEVDQRGAAEAVPAARESPQTELFSLFGADTPALSDQSEAQTDADPQADPLAGAVQVFGRLVPDVLYAQTMQKYQLTVNRTHTVYRWSGAEPTAEQLRVTEWEDKDTKTVPRTAMRIDGELLDQRICPHCHCEIPGGFLTADDNHVRSIALIGGTRAGKTQYMVAMLQNLKLELSANLFLGNMDICPDSERFTDLLELQLQQTTRTGTTRLGLIFPVLMRIIPREKPGFESPKPFFLRIFDCAGEVYKNRKAIINQRGLREGQVDAAMVLVDPAQIWGDAVILNKRDKGEHYSEPMSELLNEVQDAAVLRGLQRVAAVMTKLDLVLMRPRLSELGCDDQGHPVHGGSTLRVCDRSLEAHTDGVDLGEIRQVDLNMKSFAYSTPKGKDLFDSIVKKLNVDESSVTRFGVSTYRWASDEERRAAVVTRRESSEQEVQGEISRDLLMPCTVADSARHRTIEPILYLMAVWGLIAVKQAATPGPEKKR